MANRLDLEAGGDILNKKREQKGDLGEYGIKLPEVCGLCYLSVAGAYCMYVQYCTCCMYIQDCTVPTPTTTQPTTNSKHSLSFNPTFSQYPTTTTTTIPQTKPNQPQTRIAKKCTNNPQPPKSKGKTTPKNGPPSPNPNNLPRLRQQPLARTNGAALPGLQVPRHRPTAPLQVDDQQPRVCQRCSLRYRRRGTRGLGVGIHAYE